MEAQELSLAEFIGDKKTFIIPIYQRNYDWRKEHCLQLFEDIKNIVASGKPHFLGTVVYQKQKEGIFSDFVIVDGQQRITSVILLAKAICEFSDSEDISEDLRSKFINHSLGEMKNKCKLRPNEYDREIFEKLMDGVELDEKEKISVLYQNYCIFQKEISDSKLTAQQLYDAIYKLKIVRILLHDEKPQEIFESLNSTGKDLTETELIRNYLLMELNSDVQENLYQKYWLPIEKMLRNSEIFEKFMFQYLVSRRKSITDMQGKKNIHISKNALYPTFKKYFDNTYSGSKNDKTEDFLADMYDYAEFYSRLLSLENEDFEKLSALEKKFYELRYLVGASSSPIILMDLNDKYEKFYFDEYTFLQIVDALISLMFRAKVCKKNGADSAQNYGNIISRFEKDKNYNVDSFWKAITEGNGKYTCPNDEQFKEALENPALKLSLKDTCKYLLYKLEKNAANAQNLPRYENSHLHYVMPEKLSQTWIKYLESKNDLKNHAAYLNSLGNLILNCNPKKDDSSFFEKRADSSDSNFYYTKSLKYFLDWTSRQIFNRSKTLAERALQVWEIPAQYAKSISIKINNYNLDDNFEDCKGKKPASLVIDGEEIPNVKHWYEVLREVLNYLYEKDKKIFIQAAAEYISTNAENFATPMQISGNFYTEIKRDAKTLLNRIKTIVENFDSLSGENIKDSIYFTLKD